MAEVRKKTLVSTLIIYVGFIIGAVNTYLFTKNHFFTEEEYGLTRVFIDISTILASLSVMGGNAVVYKFYPFYTRNLSPKNNDLLANTLVWASMGFLIVLIAGFFGKDIFVRKFSARSQTLVNYYYWLFPCAYFLGLYTLIEAFAWQLQKIAVTNFLKETLFRLFTTVLICLKLADLISFHLFMILFALQYAVLFGILMYYLIVVYKLKLVFRISIVTKKFYKQILSLASYVYAGSIIHTVAMVLGAILIANKDGLGNAAVYTFANYFVNILQAPQRSIISISIPLLSIAWKDKDYAGIKRIYQRSSINMLVASLFLFFILWMEMDTAIHAFHINPVYLQGKPVFLIMSIYWIIELGTGVNSQIIGTSNDWRFEFISGIILLALTIPTNYILVSKLGMIGAAYSGLISITIYNTIRFLFIWNKYKLQPFTINTLKLLLISGLAYAITALSTSQLTGFVYIIVTPILFIILYFVPIYFLNITPDIKPVVMTTAKRLGIMK